MNVKQNGHGFELQNLTAQELEIIQIGLIRAKHEDFMNTEIFNNQRELCDSMYGQIDEQLIISKS